MAFGNELISAFVLLDLSTVFATTDHKILLQILEHTVCIRWTVLQWSESYLLDRFPIS